jgi:hypothetical protein
VPGIGHRQRDVGGIGTVGEADEPALPGDLGGQQRQRDQRLVVLMADVGRRLERGLGKPGHDVKKHR